MARKQANNVLVGVDIGTSKIVCLIAEVDENRQLNIIGYGQHPSIGLKRGVVVNIEATVDSIQKAVEAAENMSNVPVRTVYTGIAGSHIQSFNSHGIVAISDNEVVQSDVDRVIEAARAVAIPADQRVLHILPQEFIIDHQSGIKEPLGMSGVRLEALVHIITGAVSSAQNVVKCIQQCGLNPADMIVEQLASSYAVLNEDEKTLGVCMIDIGGGTTDVAIYANGAIQYTSAIPIAGDQVTNDIAIAFRAPTQGAEKIKLNHACCLIENASEEETIEIPSVANNREPHRISEKALARVIQPRYEELFRLVKNELQRSGLEALVHSGLVLTGGGANAKYAVELAEKVFQTPVRLGVPTNVNGLTEVVDNPCYATAVGLLLYGLQENDSGIERTPRPGLKSLFAKMRGWLQANL
ncbi:MAG: cell division protein FtsA [Gammaproteobacteria bacterium]